MKQAHIADVAEQDSHALALGLAGNMGDIIGDDFPRII